MGMDLLTQFQCKIDLFNGCLSFYNDTVVISLQRLRDSSRILGRVGRNFTLAANTEAIMSISVPPSTSPGTYIMEGLQTPNYGTYAVARAVVDVSPMTPV